jgi:proteic killer suppression protein
MIKSFRDNRTQKIFSGKKIKEYQGFYHQAVRRLQILDAAVYLNDLMQLPSNQFKALGGDRKGQFSIRINQQWRICFKWDGEDAYNVAITDYH